MSSGILIFIIIGLFEFLRINLGERLGTKNRFRCEYVVKVIDSGTENRDSSLRTVYYRLNSIDLV